MELQFIFRKPIFPMVCSIDGYFIGAKTKKHLEKELAKLELPSAQFYNLADFSGEGWTLHLETISPLTFHKRWTKKDIIQLFNGRTNLECGNGIKYSEKSLSSKKLDKIITDIANLAFVKKE
jgi:hypothetical protein